MTTYELIPAPTQDEDASINIILEANPELKPYLVGNRLQFPKGLSFKAWQKIGARLQDAQDVIDRTNVQLRMFRADWWHYGKTVYGETRALVAEAMFEVAAVTMANDASELSKVTDAARNVPGASWNQIVNSRYAEPEKQADIVRHAVEHKQSGDEVRAIAKGTDPYAERMHALKAQIINAFNQLDTKTAKEVKTWIASQK